ncbi:ABC transporter ATP-binding protein [Pelagibacterium flavum]|uniref:ABC transporter ATP-binding protein n=2 Tax=Pelagibacterium flavum TaxID=2984530 RepID=A0ABY6IQT0_9HYPH|nr:ABC transporter ATP-binding protein [Pelagibacterium sp. YIM 151497]UYQ72977.1 ABC transporter ATP-binding protein [Pelagibacterium sp. YIM 151497]|eukprot:jgi/Tetstr1/451594/TSEL_038630.t1
MTMLEVTDLSVSFKTPDGTVRAVNKMNFSIGPGQTLAIVGESGSGKSQTVMAAMGLLAGNGEVEGSVKLDGQELIGMKPGDLNKIRGRDMAMIFQDPMTSLNPYLSIADQMTEVLMFHQRMKRSEAMAKSEEMLKTVHLPDPRRILRRYPHELSGGQRQRVMIAMALLCDPKVLIADEPTTALDVTVQAQMLKLFEELTDKFNTALIIITHDLGVVAGLADEMMVMYAGRVVEQGPVEDLFYDPRHPYTFGLLHSTPHLKEGKDRLAPIKGLPPNLTNLPPGCAFNPRCPFRFDRCIKERPQLIVREHERLSACFYEGEMTEADMEKELAVK